MECELCALEGQVGEAINRCADCGEWICDLHLKPRADGAPLCPTCFESQEEGPDGLDLAAESEDLG